MKYYKCSKKTQPCNIYPVTFLGGRQNRNFIRKVIPCTFTCKCRMRSLYGLSSNNFMLNFIRFVKKPNPVAAEIRG
jgi:hypothetical protein